MKIILAPDKFKGTLSAQQFCAAASSGLKRALPDAEIISLPLSDGGDGLLEVLAKYGRFETIHCIAQDPLFRQIETYYLFEEESATAFIEMAKVSGLGLLAENEKNCMNTSSIGLGQLILYSIERGAERIFLGLGGSATNDAGAGMAQALGYIFKDIEGRDLIPVGGNLSAIRSIEKPDLTNISFKALVDVKNPLLGQEGAVQMYASQKGAMPDDLPVLEKGLETMACFFKELFGKEVKDLPGAGAAGGTGAGCMAFLSADVLSGAAYMLEKSGFHGHLDKADLVITGEGKLDGQSRFGKIPWEVADKCRQSNIPVVAITGQYEGEHNVSAYFNRIITLVDHAVSTKEAMDYAYDLVETISFDLGRHLNKILWKN